MEAWTREEKDNLSWSHPWASAPGTAIPRGFFGINPTSPGYKRFTIQPQPGSVLEASIAVPTHAGLIKASFVQAVGKSFVLELTPPSNTLAKVRPRQCSLPSMIVSRHSNSSSVTVCRDPGLPPDARSILDLTAGRWQADGWRGGGRLRLRRGGRLGCRRRGSAHLAQLNLDLSLAAESERRSLDLRRVFARPK